MVDSGEKKSETVRRKTSLCVAKQLRTRNEAYTPSAEIADVSKAPDDAQLSQRRWSLLFTFFLSFPSIFSSDMKCIEYHD